MLFFKKKKQPEAIKDKLVFLFKGSDGHNYYRWPKDLALTNERYLLANGLMTNLAIGMSGKELMEAFDTLELLIADGLKNPQNLAKIAATVAIMKAAQNHTVHRDLLINLAAVYVVRDDEKPEEVNQDIMQQKLDYFDKNVNEPKDFFLQISIEELSELHKLSKEELNRLWQASPQRVKEVTNLLNRFRQETLSTALEQTS